MKAWIVLLLLVVSATSYTVSAKGIELEITPKRQNFTQWQDAKFQVRIVPVDGFDAQVYVRLTESTLPWNYVKAASATIYPPYAQTFDVTVSAAAWSLSGEQRIIVEAVNGLVSDRDTFYVVAPQHKEWRRITSANSLLPEGTVRQIIHDRDGTAWIIAGYGATSGLLRIGTDGSQELITSATIDSTQVGRFITGAAIDNSDALWVSWDINVSRYKDGRWTTYNFRNAPIPYMIGAWIMPDRAGNVWLIESNRITRFDGTTADVFGVGLTGKEFLPPGFHITLFDEQNRLWGRTDNGLMRYEDGIWREIPKSEIGVPSNATFWGLTYDNDEVLTVTYTEQKGNGGVIKFRDNRWQLEETIPANDQPYFAVGYLFFDSKGVMWMTSAKVVGRYDGSEWRYFNTYNSGFPDDLAYTMSFAPDGSVWLTTEKSGVVIYSPDVPSSVPVNSLSDVASNAMTIAPNPVSDGSFSAIIELKQASDVQLTITDLLGREIERRVIEDLAEGRQEIRCSTASISDGIYIVRLSSADGICSVPCLIRK